VKELSLRCAGLRVLALSATPGSDPASIQQVVSNLRIARLEARDEHSVDVVGCLHRRIVDKLLVAPTAPFVAARNAALELLRAYLHKLRQTGVAVEAEPSKARRYTLLRLQQELGVAPPAHMQKHQVFRAQAMLSVGMLLARRQVVQPQTPRFKLRREGGNRGPCGASGAATDGL